MSFKPFFCLAANVVPGIICVLSRYIQFKEEAIGIFLQICSLLHLHLIDVIGVMSHTNHGNNYDSIFVISR